ncbi:MAG: hypothetical protein LBJ73_04855 [Rickettsiales bacterium]|nr:hypothetical protein [Rickettsiales bacterium]
MAVLVPTVSHADVAATSYVDTAIAAKEDIANKITSVSGGGSGITSAATDAQYPSAKAVYDIVSAGGPALESVTVTMSYGMALQLQRRNGFVVANVHTAHNNNMPTLDDVVVGTIPAGWRSNLNMQIPVIFFGYSNGFESFLLDVQSSGAIKMYSPAIPDGGWLHGSSAWILP